MRFHQPHRGTVVPRIFAGTVAGLSLCVTASAASGTPGGISDGIWSVLDQRPRALAGARPWIQPSSGAAVQLDPKALRNALAAAPMQFSEAAATSPAFLDLPLPNGKLARFEVVESPIMEPGLQAQFPEFKQYAVRGADDGRLFGRIGWTDAGFDGLISTPDGEVYIDRYWFGDVEQYTSYYTRAYKDEKATTDWTCLVTDHLDTSVKGGDFVPASFRSDNVLRTYRLACAATGEYTAYQGGTVALGQAAVVAAVNRVNQVYNNDLAIQLTLVANNSNLIYTNASTDPYTNTNPSSLLTQNQSTCNSVIGSANYDIGHVFSTAGGGLAGLGVVCNTSLKAQGETGTSAPTGDAFWIDYVAHEMGHQFGGNHTFNGTGSNCSGANRNASTAYERGSGTTVMAYAGICTPDDVQLHSDPYFHSESIREILAYIIAGGACASNTTTADALPSVTAPATKTIPILTAFELTATGSDPDAGDALTYCWEQRDLGAATALSAGDNGASPLFRSLNATSSPTRMFPRYGTWYNADFAAPASPPEERLPSVSWASPMTFRCTIRDNKGAAGGRTNFADVDIAVTSAAGPFKVTAPNNAVSLSGSTTVTWNVASTTASPVSTANVDIYLSTDSGNTFPTLLLAATANDGTELVTLPNISTTTARIKVKGSGNYFFDMSNADFTITPAGPTATPTATPTPSATPTASLTPTATPTPSDTPTATPTPTPSPTPGTGDVFINEIHYDNTGTDANEGVEVAGPAGTSFSGWTIQPYNGTDGTTYTPVGTSNSTFPDQGGCYGTIWVAISGLQNGAPDGLALINPSNTVVQFLSYEGSFTATSGAASGMTSTDIGVSEGGSTAVGASLQLQGTGSHYADFTWTTSAITATRDAVNTGQTFTGCTGPTATPTASPTPSDTPTPTPSNTPSPTPSNTPSPTASNTPSPTPSNTPSPTPSDTPSPTPSDTPTPTASATPSLTPTATPPNQPPAAAAGRPILAARISTPSVDPEGGTVQYTYAWTSTGGDTPVTHGPTTAVEDSLSEAVDPVTFDEGETWTITVTPTDPQGTPGPSFFGTYIIGAGGTVTFSGWTAR